jgi:hypothetical protein
MIYQEIRLYILWNCRVSHLPLSALCVRHMKKRKIRKIKMYRKNHAHIIKYLLNTTYESSRKRKVDSQSNSVASLGNTSKTDETNKEMSEYPLPIEQVEIHLQNLIFNPFRHSIQSILSFSHDVSADRNKIAITYKTYDLLLSRLFYAIETNPPANILSRQDRENTTPGYAYDDLINAYLIFLSDQVPRFGAQTSFALTDFLVGSPNTGDRDEHGIRKFMYKERYGLFGQDGMPVYDQLVLPWSKEIHWALVRVNFRTKTIEHYDSLAWVADRDVLETVKKYIELCYVKQATQNADLDYIEGWEIIDFSDTKRFPKNEIPKQDNAVDCGFFVMEIAKFMALGWPITKKQPYKKSIPFVRKRCIFELANNMLLKF